MQKLQRENWTLGEKRSDCAIWQPVPGVTRAVHVLNESRWASVLRAGCRRSPLPRQRATGGLLFAERIQQTYLQRSTHPLRVCHRLSGGCPAASPSRPAPLPPAPAAGFQPRNPWQPSPHHCSPTGETQTQTQSCLQKNSNRALGLCFKERTRWIKNVPRTTRMALLYFHKEVSPNCTLTVFSRTNLFPPNADSRGSPSVCVCRGGGGLLCGSVCTSRACADGIIVYFFNFQR